jgi:hypothetical protein
VIRNPPEEFIIDAVILPGAVLPTSGIEQTIPQFSFDLVVKVQPLG